jgi:DNA-binding NtrC family response regulator
MKVPKILIAEDDAFFRDSMERLLQISGYETRSCSCGKEALARLAEEVFDILISDFRMPGMDGLELIGKARNMDPTMAMILVTGVPPEDLGDRLKKSRLDAFLSKPLDWQGLSLLLESLCRMKRQGSGEFGAERAVG